MLYSITLSILAWHFTDASEAIRENDIYKTESEVFMAVKISSTVYLLFDFMICPEDWTGIFLRNVGNNSYKYTADHNRQA